MTTPPLPPDDTSSPNLPSTTDGDSHLPAQPGATSDGDLPGMRSLVTFSLLTGLCALIPIPFLDDWALKWMRRRAALDACRRQGVQVSDLEIELLANGDGRFDATGCLKGCFLGALIKTMVYVVKKIFQKALRTVLFFLTLRSMLNNFSQTFHEVFLLRHALSLGTLPSGATSDYPRPQAEDPRQQAFHLRRAVEAAYGAIDHGPFTKILRATFAGSRGVLRHVARSIIRPLRNLRRHQASDADIEEQIFEQSEEELGGLINSLTQEISKETEYLKRQRATLEEMLGRPES